MNPADAAPLAPQPGNTPAGVAAGEAAFPAPAITAARERLEAESENILKAFHARLARLTQSAAAQVGAQLQTHMKQAADDLEAKRKAAEILDGRLAYALLQVNEAARNGTDLAARLKSQLSEAAQKEAERAAAAGQRSQEAVQKADAEIRQALEQAAREAVELTAQQMEAAATQHITGLEEVAHAQSAASQLNAQRGADEIEQAGGRALAALRDEWALLKQAAAERLQAEARSADEALGAKWQARAGEIRQTLGAEVAARMTAEFTPLRDAVKAEASEILRAEKEHLAGEIATARADLQQAAAKATAGIGSYATELLAVLQSERATTLKQARLEIDSALQASVGRVEAAVKAHADQVPAMAASAVNEAWAQIRTEAETLRKESELALRQLSAAALEDAKQCLGQEVAGAFDNFKESFDAHCQAQGRSWTTNLQAVVEQKQAELEQRLLQEFNVKSAAALEDAKRAISSALAGQSEELKLAATQTAQELKTLIEDEAWTTIDTGQKHFEAWLQQSLEQWKAKAASQWPEDRQRFLDDLKRDAEQEAERLRAQVAGKLNESLELEQAQVISRSRAAIESEVGKTLEGFNAYFAAETERLRTGTSQALGHSLETTLTRVRQDVEQLMQEPLQQLARYVEDTLVLAREEVGKLQQERMKSVEESVAGVTRRAFTSISSEAQSLGESYRKQMAETLEALVTRSTESLKQFYAEEHEKQREMAFSHLQKDAEDFSAVAVGQFRSQSEKAMRESLNLVNQQVGAAALVVKEWLDQTTARLDAHLAKLEAKSSESLAAIESSAQRSAQMILGTIQQESEALVGEMQNRMQLAARVLEGLPAGMESKTPAPEPVDRRASVSVRRVLTRS